LVKKLYSEQFSEYNKSNVHYILIGIFKEVYQAKIFLLNFYYSPTFAPLTNLTKNIAKNE